MRPTLVWYNAEEDELGCNVFLDGFFFALETDMIPWNYVLIGEL
jgi:hypothetical protein